MSSKDLRRFALEKWKRNWPTILASFFLLFVAYIALAICFSFILGPFLATTIMFVLTGVRSGINLSIFGILIAFIFFSFIFFLLLGSFSFIYMALKMVRGEKVSPFAIFFALNLKHYPMQRELIDYGLYYAAVPWSILGLFILFLGFGPSHPLVDILQEVLTDFCIGLFLLFNLCAPFLLLERKAKNLTDALFMSDALMHHALFRACSLLFGDSTDYSCHFRYVEFYLRGFLPPLRFDPALFLFIFNTVLYSFTGKFLSGNTG